MELPLIIIIQSPSFKDGTTGVPQNKMGRYDIHGNQSS
jgi:hypothetical protein